MYLSTLPVKKGPALEDFALGKGTTSLFAEIDSTPIHCKSVIDAAGCLAGVRRRDQDRLVVWLGNSQVHAVNQLHKGEQNSPPLLFRKLAANSIDLLTFSQPNANLQEHYVLFEYLLARTQPSFLLLPLVFDDMRETGIRPDISAGIDAQLTERLNSSDIGRRILASMDAPAEDDDMAALHETVQEQSEAALDAWFTDHIPLWGERPALRGTLITSLYRLRNFIFGITPNTKRKVIKGRYQTNSQALQQILATATKHDVRVLAYIVPLRNDVEIPYLRSEYAAYKHDMEKLVTTAGHHFTDLEGLVPGELWGSKEATTVGGEAELDFMHFQAGGHRLLANALYEYLGQNLQEDRP